jgi:hypothetical protein
VNRVALGAAPVLGDTHVARGDALHAPVLAVEHLGAGEAGIDLDPQLLRLLGEPAAEIAEADHVVPVVAEKRRHRQAVALALGEEQHAVLARGRVDGCALRLPVGDQLVQRARLEHRAGQDVRADLGALFDQAHAELPAGRRGELLQADRAREARRPAADDHDVVLHRFALHGRRFLSRAADDCGQGRIV